MASIPRRRAQTNIVRIPGRSAMPVAQPMREMGVSGVAVFGGRVYTRERNSEVAGARKWITYADLVTNTSIVAAGTRYFLNLIAHANWRVNPANDTAQAKEVAEFIESVIHDMDTPWSRVIRKASTYRFYGFGVQEWIAKRREQDGKFGLQDIEARPQHTIEEWEVNERGEVTGMYQRSPQTGALLPLPRGKTVYLVEDSLTDSPEGLGMFRHLVEPYKRLEKYLLLEGQGFERDLRGIPIGRVPYTALRQAVQDGRLTRDDAASITYAIEEFVKTQSRKEDTSLVLDSAPYMSEIESGRPVSGVMQYGIELLQGQTPGFADLNNAITRLNKEMARIIGVEHLLLGDDSSSGNRALSEDKSRNFYLTANGTLGEIGDALDHDMIRPVCMLNAIPRSLWPWFGHSDIAFRSVKEITAALRDMATAGAVLSPEDPAIDDVRDLLGIQRSVPLPLPLAEGLLGKPQNRVYEDEDDHRKVNQ